MKKWVESDRMNIEKVKWKKNMFDGLFIYQHISTSILFFNAKVFYQNYFSMRNNYER